MAYLDGANTILGIKKATTLGTAVAIGANDKVEGGSFNSSEAAVELVDGIVGSGDSMHNDSQRGAVLPTASLAGGALRFAGADIVALAQLMGTASVSGPGAGGYYHHSITFNETANAAYLTIAQQVTTASVMEMTTAITTRANISFQDPPTYVLRDMDFLGNAITYASGTNTAATIANATAQDTDRIVVQYASTVRINTQTGGALAAGDAKAVTGLTLELSRPQEFTREVKGSAGLGAPRTTGDVPFSGTLTLTFKSLDDVNWLLDHQSGKEFKIDFKVESSASANKFFEVSIPRAKIVQSPSVDFANPGSNPFTVTFKLLVASAAPTGMISAYPYFRIANSRSTGFLA